MWAVILAMSLAPVLVVQAAMRFLEPHRPGASS
jgi:hypothetical protein